MPNNSETVIAASVNQDQSTHNSVISNAATMLLIGLASKYLPNVVEGGVSSSSSSSLPKATSMILVDIGNQAVNNTIKERQTYYETRKASQLEKDTLSWLKKTLDSKPNHNFDRVTLVQMQGEVKTETEWYLPLSAVYPIVLSALYDLDETCWPVPEGASAKIERDLRLMEFDRVNNALANANPVICATGIRHSWAMALNGYEGKYLPLSEEHVLHRALFDFMVHDVFANQMGIHLPDGRDPMSAEWDLFQAHFQGVFLPWILSRDMPDSVKTAIVEAGGSAMAAEKIRARFQAIGIAPDDKKLAGYSYPESLQLLPCNFTPLLNELNGWITRHNNSPNHLIDKTVEWLKGAKDMKQIRFVLRFVDTLKLYKDNRLLLDCAELPIEENLSWQNVLNLFSTGLQDVESSPQQWLDNPEFKQQVIAFEKGYTLWRTSSYKDFISNYFALWFANQDLQSQGKLFVTLTELYLHEATKNHSMQAIIEMSDERLTQWMAQADNEGLLHLEPYQINRILLHALCYPREQWSALFRISLNSVIAFIEAGFNQASNLVSESLAKDSWPQALITDMKAISEGHSVANPVVLTPALITDESSLKASGLLAAMPHVPSAVIQAIVNAPNFNPNALNDEGLSPLYYAAEYGHIQLAIALFHKEANPLKTFRGYTPLYVAIKHHSLSFVKSFLRAMPESFRVKALTVKHYNQEFSGQTILNLSRCQRDYLQALLELIPQEQRFEAIMVRDKDCNTLLYKATYHFERLKLLLELIPKEQRFEAIMARGNDHNTLLHKAAYNFERLKLLLELIPEEQRFEAVMAKSKYYNTVLYEVAHDFERLKLVLELIPEKQRLEAIMAVNYHGETVLHYVASKVVALKLVLESIPEDKRHQAVMVKNQSGQTLLDFVKNNPASFAVLHQLVPTLQERQLAVVLPSGSSSSSQRFFAACPINESKDGVQNDLSMNPFA